MVEVSSDFAGARRNVVFTNENNTSQTIRQYVKGISQFFVFNNKVYNENVNIKATGQTAKVFVKQIERLSEELVGSMINVVKRKTYRYMFGCLKHIEDNFILKAMNENADKDITLIAGDNSWTWPKYDIAESKTMREYYESYPKFYQQSVDLVDSFATQVVEKGKNRLESEVGFNNLGDALYSHLMVHQNPLSVGNTKPRPVLEPIDSAMDVMMLIYNEFVKVTLPSKTYKNNSEFLSAIGVIDSEGGLLSKFKQLVRVS